MAISSWRRDSESGQFEPRGWPLSGRSHIREQTGFFVSEPLDDQWLDASFDLHQFGLVGAPMTRMVGASLSNLAGPLWKLQES